MASNQSIKDIKSPFLEPPTMADCLVTDLAISWMTEDQIVHSISIPTEYNIDSVQNHFSAINKLNNGTPKPFLIDPKLSSVQMNAETRKVLASKIEANISCAAFVLDQKYLTLAINIFFKMRKSKVPFRCFTNVEQAKKWIREKQNNA